MKKLLLGLFVVIALFSCKNPNSSDPGKDVPSFIGDFTIDVRDVTAYSALVRVVGKKQVEYSGFEFYILKGDEEVVKKELNFTEYENVLLDSLPDGSELTVKIVETATGKEITKTFTTSTLPWTHITGIEITNVKRDSFDISWSNTTLINEDDLICVSCISTSGMESPWQDFLISQGAATFSGLTRGQKYSVTAQCRTDKGENRIVTEDCTMLLEGLDNVALEDVYTDRVTISFTGLDLPEDTVIVADFEGKDIYGRILDTATGKLSDGKIIYDGLDKDYKYTVKVKADNDDPVVHELSIPRQNKKYSPYWFSQNPQGAIQKQLNNPGTPDAYYDCKYIWQNNYGYKYHGSKVKVEVYSGMYKNMKGDLLGDFMLDIDATVEANWKSGSKYTKEFTIKESDINWLSDNRNANYFEPCFTEDGIEYVQ